MPICKASRSQHELPTTKGAVPLVIAAFWSLVCLIQIGAGLSDGKGEGGEDILKIVIRTVLANLPFAAYCLIQHLRFARNGYLALSERQIAIHLVFSSAVFFVPLVVFQAAINPIVLGPEPWHRLGDFVQAYPALYWTFDYLVFAGCFAALLAGHLWLFKQKAEREHAAAITENLELRLSLEQQRIQILQAQLEPHFMFNALNAISALVRGDERKQALQAIGKLSALLRLAVAASRSTEVSLQEEYSFIEDYLALQQLRFGDRLRIEIADLPDELSDVSVPPFVLQPLVENAIRHDVESHSETGWLSVSNADLGDRLRIVVRNSRRANVSSSPGAGIGLANLRSRISLAYGGVAKFEVNSGDNEFVVAIELPKESM